MSQGQHGGKTDARLLTKFEARLADAYARDVYIPDFAAKLGIVVAVAFVTVLLLPEHAPTVILSLLRSPEVLALVSVPAAVTVVPGLMIAVYILLSVPETRLSGTVLGGVFLLGATATFAAGALNASVVGGFASLPYGMVLFFFVFVAPVEEGLKLLAVYLYPHDGLSPIEYAVMGGFGGLGFSFAESILYLFGGGAANPAGFIVGRACVSSVHVTVSAVAAYYMGRVRETDGLLDAGRMAGKGFVAAVVIHAAYNSLVVNFATTGGATAPEARAVGFVLFVALFCAAGYIIYTVVEEGRRSAIETC